MLYTIVQDIPGRLRLRCGAGLFSDEESFGIADSLKAIDGVSTAVVHAVNGSILVTYHAGAREAVLACVDSLDVLALPTAAWNASQDIQLEDDRFKLKLVEMIGWRIIRRLILPAPIRAAFDIIRAVRYIAVGIRQIARGKLTVEVLDAAAILASLLRGEFASAGAVMFLLRISDLLQNHVNARARIALEQSLLVRAETVWAVEDGKDVEVSLHDVQPGMLIRIRSGASIPVDATVIEGEGEINEASMTGESALVHKEKGSTVFAGTIVEEGSLVVRVDALPGASRIDGIVSLVEASSAYKATAQSKAERLADNLVPWSFAGFFGVLALTRNVTKAVSVLMVDYSCAIKLSTPIAVMSAMREAARHGAVVKGGKYLEAFAKADTIVFDKTGTLTEAAPQVEKVISFGDMAEDEILNLAACLEEHYPHSIARAIVRSAQAKGLVHGEENHAEVKYIVAHGIASEVQGRTVIIGSEHFVFGDEGVKRPRNLKQTLRRKAPAASTVFLAIDGVLAGAICVSDPLRPEAADCIAKLKAAGITHTVMLTGDSTLAAETVAGKLGIDEYHAQVLPEDKAGFIEDLKAQGRTVIMVGDGINDSPALAAANVSVALNDATDIARAVSDVSMKDASLESLVMMRELSCRLMDRISRDYRFIVTFNTALIALGIFSVITPTLGAYLHNISTVGVTLANTRPLLTDTMVEQMGE